MTFAKYVLNRFFSLAAQNNKAYVELLFWKNVGAVREMTEGYSKDGLVFSSLPVCVMLSGPLLPSYKENMHLCKIVRHTE